MIYKGREELEVRLQPSCASTTLQFLPTPALRACTLLRVLLSGSLLASLDELFGPDGSILQKIVAISSGYHQAALQT